MSKELCQSLSNTIVKLEQKVVIRTGLFIMTMLTILVYQTLYFCSGLQVCSFFHLKVAVISCIKK